MFWSRPKATPRTKGRKMKYTLYLSVVVLVVAHQDVFNWHDSRLVLGCLPVGLAYHVAYTLVTALMWALAIRWAWPGDVDVPVDE